MAAHRIFPHPKSKIDTKVVVQVERTKKCLDFTATLYVIHLFCCVFYKGIPSTMEW